MARKVPLSLTSISGWTCRQCRGQVPTSLQPVPRRKLLSTSSVRKENTTVVAAPEIDFKNSKSEPARVLPASPSYFTAAPLFNDHVLRLQQLVRKHGSLPTAPPDQVPRLLLMSLLQYRSSVGEKVASSKYAQTIELLRRLNMIHPQLRTKEVNEMIDRFRRPGASALQTAKVGKIDEFGRAKGVGRRKESSARVYLVEGTGEVRVNGKSVLQVFPRLHDRESALWPLKITERTDKYNVFAVVEGGGVTGQAESITLALTKALLVHEPALKPALRKAGCVTRIMKRVERKKPGRLKARKKPAWVKR